MKVEFLILINLSKAKKELLIQMEVMKEEHVDVQDGKIVDEVVNDEPIDAAPVVEDKQ